MRYKVSFIPYFYVWASTQEDAIKQARGFTINAGKGTVRPPQGVLVESRPAAEEMTYYIATIKEEPEDDGQGSIEGEAEEESPGEA